MNDSITVSEAASIRTRLEELEGVISEGLQTFVEVGNAIREIRDNRLYRESHGTFEEYCKERWGWSRVRAHHYIEAANTSEMLTTVNTPGPTNERQARELGPLVKEDPEKARGLWGGLTEEHGNELTAAHVKKAVQEVKEADSLRRMLPEKTRTVVEGSDPEDCSMPRNPAQLRHLRDIAVKRGDDAASEVAERVANGEFKSTFDAYPEVKAESIHFSSETPEWYTPPKILERVKETLGGVDTDPCADPQKSVEASIHYTKGDDGLAQEWRGAVYMNPPYGNSISDWVKKLTFEYASGNTTAAIALVPARTDTEWFSLLRDFPRCFIRGRLKFSGHENSAPFPSCAFYLGDDEAAFIRAFQDLGDIFRRVEW